jgi:hypothetical protein
VPGNKKNRRKAPPKTKNLVARYADHMENARAGKTTRRHQMQKSIDKKNNLPLGHPLNRHSIDSTFKPLDDLLDDQEAGRGMLQGEDGQLYIYDPQGQEMVTFIPGMLHMCRLYDLVAQAQTWSKQPPGLLAFVLKLARDEKVNQQDIDDARATVRWMKDNVATITRTRWTEVFEWASKFDAEQMDGHGDV